MKKQNILLVVLIFILIGIFIGLLNYKNILPKKVIVLNALNNTLSSNVEIVAKGNSIYQDKKEEHELLFNKTLNENIKYDFLFKNDNYKKYIKYENKELIIDNKTYTIKNKKFTIDKIDYEKNIYERLIFLIFDNIKKEFEFSQKDENRIEIKLDKESFTEFTSGFLTSIANDPLIQEIIENKYKISRTYREEKNQLYYSKFLEFNQKYPIENITLSFLIDNNKVISITYIINLTPSQSHKNPLKIEGIMRLKS